RNDDTQGGFFGSAQDFWGFVNSKGAAVSPETQQAIPLVFDAVYNFRIRSVGDYGGATREITAVTFDLQSMAGKIASQIQRDAAGGPAPAASTGNSSTTSTDPLPKGPPRIVYYNEN